MGKPLVRFWEGQECNCDMDEILWHRRESRRQRRKQTSSCNHGSLLSTRKASAMPCSLIRTMARTAKRAEARIVSAGYPAPDFSLSDEIVDLKYFIYLSE
jgi:hypothetical protein